LNAKNGDYKASIYGLTMKYVFQTSDQEHIWTTS